MTIFSNIFDSFLPKNHVAYASDMRGGVGTVPSPSPSSSAPPSSSSSPFSSLSFFGNRGGASVQNEKEVTENSSLPSLSSRTSSTATSSSSTSSSSSSSPLSAFSFSSSVGSSGVEERNKNSSPSSATSSSPSSNKSHSSDSTNADDPWGGSSSLSSSSSSSSSASSPLQYEQYSREYQNITMQDNFDGFRLEAAKSVNKYLQTCHTLFLGTQLREAGYMYQFGPTFALDDGSLLLMGRASLDGTVNARLLKRITKDFEVRVNSNSSLTEEQRNMYEFSFDNTGKDWATSLKLAWQGTWIINGAFSQMIHPRFHMGGELTWIAANGASIGALGARYVQGKDVYSCQVSRQPDFKSPAGLTKETHSVKVQYVRKITDRLSAATELEYTHPDMESAVKIGWEYSFRHAKIQGLIDTCGRVSLCAQDASGFGVSGVIDYWRNDYKFGFMMHVVPPPEGAAASSPP